jgi:hypothetical protein
MDYDPANAAPPPLRFRDLGPADVAAGLDQLRRQGRTTL